MPVEVNGRTEIVGIFGHPVKHSLSPRMHNAAFRELGLNMIYLPFEVRAGDLRESMEAVRMLNFVGVNLTQPHKVSALEHVDRLSEEARHIAAINTVVNHDGILVGHNTDGEGFVRSLKEDYRFDPRAKNIVVFGAGGAARAICRALHMTSFRRLIIVNRTVEKAESLAAQVGGEALPWNDPGLKEQLSQAHLVVNAASTSLYLDPRWAQEQLLIYDIVYRQRGCEWIRKAQQRGVRVADGRSMLLYQGALAFRLWTGQEAPLEAMRQALWPESGGT